MTTPIGRASTIAEREAERARHIASTGSGATNSRRTLFGSHYVLGGTRHRNSVELLDSAAFVVTPTSVAFASGWGTGEVARYLLDLVSKEN